MNVDQLIEGSWPAHCEQRAFVDGAKWWQYRMTKFTAFPSEVDAMEAEAIERYGQPEAVAKHGRAMAIGGSDGH